jgi:hypothetical protein
MTTTTDPHAEREHRARKLGDTYVSDHSCPRKLVGKRCRNNYDYGACWCTDFTDLGRHLHDHGATWRSRHGTLFVLWEPYGADGDVLAELVATARHDGLAVRVCESVWNPPHTIGIRFDPVGQP